MENYTIQIDIATITPNNTYKITTNKTTFLAKFVGRNKNEGLHFVLDSNKHTIVINPSDIIAIYEL
jgi:hypothetical protein